MLMIKAATTIKPRMEANTRRFLSALRLRTSPNSKLMHTVRVA